MTIPAEATKRNAEHRRTAGWVCLIGGYGRYHEDLPPQVPHGEGASRPEQAGGPLPRRVLTDEEAAEIRRKLGEGWRGPILITWLYRLLADRDERVREEDRRSSSG